MTCIVSSESPVNNMCGRVPWEKCSKGLPRQSVTGGLEREAELWQSFERLMDALRDRVGKERLMPTERWLWVEILKLGALLIGWFLALSHEELEVPASVKRGRARFVRQRAKPKTVRTLFGKVRYVRDYMLRQNGKGGGYSPLDEALGLTQDGFTMPVLSFATQLATKMSYSAATAVLKGFLGWSPSVKSIERAVLGVGGYAEDFALRMPPPKGDGEVIVGQVDGKGHPTVRDGEMKKRRKRRKKPGPGKKKKLKSQRHRGRNKRRTNGPKKRRKAGDKSKNAKVVHVIVLYTLKQDGGRLVGPLNKRVYIYTGTKRGAIRRMRDLIDRRGFEDNSGKQVQLVTDGDSIYADEIRKCFPHARHTLDVQHAVEYLWEAAHMLYPNNASARAKWAESRKSELVTDEHQAMFAELDKRALEFSDTPPKSKNSQQGETAKKKEKQPKSARQKFLVKVDYLKSRQHMMNYHELGTLDLEWGSGVVEGACRYVVGQRFDEGGMRWLRERAAPLLHLRTIELNGWWDPFIEHVHDELAADSRRTKQTPRLLTNIAPPMPKDKAA